MRTVPSPLPYLTAIPDVRKPSRIQWPWDQLWLLVLTALCAAPKNVLALVHWIHDHAELYQQHFGLAGVPSQATLYRFVNGVDPVHLEAAVDAWIAEVVALTPGMAGTASVDGKVIKGSARSRAGQSPLLVCGAYLHQLGLPVCAASTPDHNEVGAAKRALPVLALLGVQLLVADAGYTGHQFAQTVRAAHLDYLLPLKNNQQDALMWARLACSYPAEDQVQISERRSGQTWTWTLRLTRQLPEDLTQAYAGSCCALELTRQVVADQGWTRTEVGYALSSSSDSAQHLLAAWRGHWGIENRVHHVRDTVFGEDACRARAAGPVLAGLRNVVLSVAQQLGQPVLRFTRRYAAQPMVSWARLGWLSWTQS